jgi:hypothetical protein
VFKNMPYKCDIKIIEYVRWVRLYNAKELSFRRVDLKCCFNFKAFEKEFFSELFHFFQTEKLIKHFMVKAWKLATEFFKLPKNSFPTLKLEYNVPNDSCFLKTKGKKIFWNMWVNYAIKLPAHSNNNIVTKGFMLSTYVINFL